MPARVYATVGRAADNDVVLDHPTVSSHHARLSWSGASLVVEDLSSANGTFVDGERVKAARTRPGAELRFGQVALPWSHEGLRTLLKAGVGARTLVMPTAGAPSYACGACGQVGALPSGPTPRTLTCSGCGATLRTGQKPRGQARASSVWLVLIMGLSVAVAVYFVLARTMALPVRGTTAVSQLKATLQTLKAEEHIGGHTAELIAKSFTPLDALTRNTAVKIAARTEGEFHVEQVAELWNAVRQPWRYVNDPEGHEYFATATETIQNGYVGDCDDFAITLASMVSAIGGKSRVVLMDGPRGGHAYAEACVQGEPGKVAAALTKHYRTRWRRYLTAGAPTTIAYRTSEACPIWLNLDWNSVVPGGAYEPEVWAVAIYPDGTSESLQPAAAASAASGAPNKPRTGSATSPTRAP